MIRAKPFCHQSAQGSYLFLYEEHALVLDLVLLENRLFFFDEHQGRVDLYYRSQPVARVALASEGRVFFEHVRPQKFLLELIQLEPPKLLLEVDET
jgi:hypothetical protein